MTITCFTQPLSIVHVQRVLQAAQLTLERRVCEYQEIDISLWLNRSRMIFFHLCDVLAFYTKLRNILLIDTRKESFVTCLTFAINENVIVIEYMKVCYLCYIYNCSIHITPYGTCIFRKMNT